MGAWRTMYRRLGSLLLVLVVVAACSSAAATWPASHPSGGVRDMSTLPPGTKTDSPQETGAAPIVTAGNVTVGKITVDYIYRSDLITALSHLYGTFLADYVIVTIKNENPTPVQVVVTSEVVGFTNQIRDTVTVPANDSVEVPQNPQLTRAAFDELTSERPAQMHLLVTYLDNGEPRTVIDQNNPTSVWARRDFPWVIDRMSQQQDFDLLAVMVMPLDPEVENLLAAAGRYDPLGSISSGYHAADDANLSVRTSLEDIWKAETNDYSLNYLSTTLSFAAGKPQRIRLPSEVLNQQAGNCIELTLLYASAVEALGMQPVIILLPGHAYVGVRTDDTGNSYYFVETTMIGHATFDEALTEGGKEFDETKPHIENGDADYGWVSVAEARKNGITPIPWH